MIRTTTYYYSYSSFTTTNLLNLLAVQFFIVKPTTIHRALIRVFFFCCSNVTCHCRAYEYLRSLNDVTIINCIDIDYYFCALHGDAGGGGGLVYTCYFECLSMLCNSLVSPIHSTCKMASPKGFTRPDSFSHV